MSSSGEGTIQIPMEDFYAFVRKHGPDLGGAEVLIGPPRLVIMSEEIEVAFAWGTDCNPSDWAEPSQAQRQLSELKLRSHQSQG